MNAHIEIGSLPSHEEEARAALDWAADLIANRSIPPSAISLVTTDPSAHAPAIEAFAQIRRLDLSRAFGAPMLETAQGRIALAWALWEESPGPRTKQRLAMALARDDRERAEAEAETETKEWPGACPDKIEAILNRTLLELLERPERGPKAHREIAWGTLLAQQWTAPEEPAADRIRIESARTAIGSTGSKGSATHRWIMGLDARWQSALEATGGAEATRTLLGRWTAPPIRHLVMSWARRDPSERDRTAAPLIEQLERRPMHTVTRRSQCEPPMPGAAARDRRARALRRSRAWTHPRLGRDDGMVRAGHPAIRRVIERAQSATSLALLLTDPQGFVWRYALGWTEPDPDPKVILDPRSWGTLVHATIEGAMSATGGPQVDRATLGRAIRSAAERARSRLESNGVSPAEGVWERTLDRACATALWALAGGPSGRGTVRWQGEVRFGPRTHAPSVTLPASGLLLHGAIDRLDTADDGSVWVADYKTGRRRIGSRTAIAGGAEVQRAIYALAARTLAQDAQLQGTTLIHLRERRSDKLSDVDAAVEAIDRGARAAVALLRDGHLIPGPGAQQIKSAHAIARPARLARYLAAKETALRSAAGALAEVWDAP